PPRVRRPHHLSADSPLLAKHQAPNLALALDLPADLGHIRDHDRLDAGSIARLQPAGEMNLPLEAAQDLGILAPELPLDVRLGIDYRALLSVHPSPTWGVLAAHPPDPPAPRE